MSYVQMISGILARHFDQVGVLKFEVSMSKGSVMLVLHYFRDGLALHNST